MIKWGNTTSDDVGLIVEHHPEIVLPRWRQEIIEVPGRNGDIVIPSDSFQNYEQTYEVFLDHKKLSGIEAALPKVINWLFGVAGYQKLEDSYFPQFYRYAYYAGGSSFVNYFGEYGRGTLVFNCAPEKYYKEGSREIVLDKTGGIKPILKNPSIFNAYPLIYIKIADGQEGGKIAFNDKKVTINNLKTWMYIDVKQHTAYKNKQNLINYLIGDKDPDTGERYNIFDILTLGPETTINWSNSIEQVSITPRWWTI